MNEFNSKVVLANGTVLMDLTQDTVDAAHLIKGYTAHGANGAPIDGACNFDSDTKDDDAIADEILYGKKAHAQGRALIGTMPNRGAVSGKITNKNNPYVIPPGYHDGSGVVALDATSASLLIPENIRESVVILGVEGTMSTSEGMKPQTKNITPTFTEQPITPDAPTYNCLSMVTIAPIAVRYEDNAAGGKTVTVGTT